MIVFLKICLNQIKLLDITIRIIYQNLIKVQVGSFVFSRQFQILNKET